MKLTNYTARDACAYLEANQEQFPYQMVTRLSEIILGGSTLPVNLNEVTEARYFGPECEMRFFDDGDGLEAALFREEPGDVFLDRTSALLPRFGKTLTKRQYIAFDEDGQGSVETVRLLKWEGETEHGMG